MPTASPPTTTPVVDAISRIHFSGNILPHTWFQKIRLPGGHPDSIACILLSEIVYWYRSKEVADEESGRLIGWHKRFRADKLQRSSQAFATKFGYTKRQVIDALNRLEEGGYITKELRTIKTDDGTTMANVCFIEPVVAKIEAITFLATTEEQGNDEADDADPLRPTADPLRLNADPPTPERTLQETTTRDYYKGITNVGESDDSLADKVTKKKRESNPDGSYGNPDVAALKSYFKERLGLSGLDDKPAEVNRTAWNLLRKKVEGDDRPALVRLKEMIDAAAEDSFWQGKLTSLYTFSGKFNFFQGLVKKQTHAATPHRPDDLPPSTFDAVYDAYLAKQELYAENGVVWDTLKGGYVGKNH